MDDIRRAYVDGINSMLLDFGIDRIPFEHPAPNRTASAAIRSLVDAARVEGHRNALTAVAAILGVDPSQVTSADALAPAIRAVWDADAAKVRVEGYRAACVNIANQLGVEIPEGAEAPASDIAAAVERSVTESARVVAGAIWRNVAQDLPHWEEPPVSDEPVDVAAAIRRALDHRIGLQRRATAAEYAAAVGDALPVPLSRLGSPADVRSEIARVLDRERAEVLHLRGTIRGLKKAIRIIANANAHKE